MSKKDVGNWFNGKYLDWQKSEWQKGGDGRKTIGEFAEWVGVTRVTLNRWMNGTHIPDPSYIEKIAAKLGLEIYDVLGLDRPDPLLSIVKRRWHLLPDGIRKQIAGMVERHAKLGEDDAEFESADKRVVGSKR